MQIEVLPFDLSGVGVDGGQRSPSVRGRTHVSEIYGDIENRVYHPERTPRAKLSNGERRVLGTYAELGFAWEVVMSKALAALYAHDQIMRPGEIEKDGLVGSPDGVDFHRCVLIEYKVSWKSLRRLENFEDEFAVWIIQAQAYCHMLGFNQVEWFTFWVNGDYSGSGPQTRTIKGKFTDQELVDNFERLKNHAKSMGLL